MRFHLFPFRTEKLSSLTPMVLRFSRGRVGSRLFKPIHYGLAFFCLYTYTFHPAKLWSVNAQCLSYCTDWSIDIWFWLGVLNHNFVKHFVFRNIIVTFAVAIRRLWGLHFGCRLSAAVGTNNLILQNNENTCYFSSASCRLW